MGACSTFFWRIMSHNPQDVLISLFREKPPKVLSPKVHKVHPSATRCFEEVTEGTYSDTIVANITDNPEPVEFQLAAIGALPKVDLMQHATLCNHF